jgi:hypothetical protein
VPKFIVSANYLDRGVNDDRWMVRGANERPSTEHRQKIVTTGPGRFVRTIDNDAYGEEMGLGCFIVAECESVEVGDAAAQAIHVDGHHVRLELLRDRHVFAEAGTSRGVHEFKQLLLGENGSITAVL